jgi:hypothetical protein
MTENMTEKPIGYLLWWPISSDYYVFCPDCKEKYGAYWGRGINSSLEELWPRINSSLEELWPIYEKDFGPYRQECAERQCSRLIHAGSTEVSLFPSGRISVPNMPSPSEIRRNA